MEENEIKKRFKRWKEWSREENKDILQTDIAIVELIKLENEAKKGAQ